MLVFDQARTQLLASVRRLPSERVALADASGRVLAHELVAGEPLPGFDHSAMDGYAVATVDLGENGPWKLTVAAESRAGHEARALEPGTACRIFTGAALPPRADAVVMQENVIRDPPGDDKHGHGAVVRFDLRPRIGQHVRRTGEDLARGAIAVAAGSRLTPGVLALVAMLDQAEVSVARRPRVAIVCTGDELRVPGSKRLPASIPESNSVPLAALARQAGASVRVAPIVRDEPGVILNAVTEALDGADVLITVGGVSVGDHDFVRAVLEKAGVVLDFWKVAMKPGKPLVVGKSATAHVLGLPGNPASALVTFAMFGMPLLRAMQGDVHPFAISLVGRLATPQKRSPDRLQLVRACLRVSDAHLVVDANANQSSGAVTSLAHSDGVAFVPPGDGSLEAGAPVDFVRWSDA
jgi:molybdopterin molybdotransferase